MSEQARDAIKHVVLLLLENHSFDQMLGCFKQIYPELDGVDANSPRPNSNSDGKNVFQQRVTHERQMRLDPMHENVDVMEQIADNNAGFVKNFVKEYPRSKPADRQEIMGYYPLDFLPALHALARDFTICDKWFSSLPGPTWPNRFFALSGTSSGRASMPEGVEALNVNYYTEQSQVTLFDRLNEAKKTWKIYFYDIPSSLLLKNQREPQNLARYNRIGSYFKDVAGPAAEFPDFAFIEPKYFGLDQNDDHPPHNIMKAEKLVADVYNALRSNDELWYSTLLVVLFDEHGGFYDHVIPPVGVPAPDDKLVPDDKRDPEFEFTQLGVRVPAILVSPWTERGFCSKQFDHTSLLKYLTEKWGLGPLGGRTEAANNIAMAFNPRRTEPRKDRDTVAFIRVPYIDLIPADQELERVSKNKQQAALHVFADFFAEGADAVAATAIAAAARASRWAERWFGAVAWFGRGLIRAGRALASADERRKQARIDRTSRSVRR